MSGINQYLPSSNQNTIVSKILQIALGLFVTTSDLTPHLPDHQHLSYDCSFDSECRWSTFGKHVDKWVIGRGEPDNLLWFAATGEPYALIETRGNPADSLATDSINCLASSTELSFNYWIIGKTDIEICLADEFGEKFNCTGMLNSSVMPGKVSLKIPEMQKPFRIFIQPNMQTGVVLLDDIHYDAKFCKTDLITVTSHPKEAPYSIITPPSRQNLSVVLQETKSAKKSKEESSLMAGNNKSLINNVIAKRTWKTTTESSFDIFIFGNKTKPMKDKRTGVPITSSTQLLCDFNDEFSCQWGPEAGRWAVIEKGAIPTLENLFSDPTLLPTFPAGLVLQGTSMLSSDPIPCQTGFSKILFRYWSNGGVKIQVCAFGYGNQNSNVYCVDQVKSSLREKQILAVFEIDRSINETFTLNIVPQWKNELKNKFLVIDEIAYIGQCHSEIINSMSEKRLKLTTNSNFSSLSTKTKLNSTTSRNFTTNMTTSNENLQEKKTDISDHQTKQSEKLLSLRNLQTTFSPIYPNEEFIQATKNRRKYFSTTTLKPNSDDYCDLLNCSFDDTACNYLNHGLTKKPWTLRNRGYGYPLIGSNDIRPTRANGQFVSTILDSTDIAVLESPKFNATPNFNVLLFQYFRPSQMTTIRLCLGSRFTNPMKTVSSFVQCPSILRSVTAKNAYRWNTVHIQLPPGTTYFYLVAHNSEKSDIRSAIAIDNLRVAICDFKGFSTNYIKEATDFQKSPQVLKLQTF